MFCFTIVRHEKTSYNTHRNTTQPVFGIAEESQNFSSFNDFNSGRLFQKQYNKDSFLSMLKNFGKIAEQKQNKEMVIVKLVLRK